MKPVKKKLIEVALPLEAINLASASEKSIRHGHPSTLHIWWARRPLAAARAVIFAQMVDDPSSYPDLFPTEKAQEKERQRLFKIIEQLVQWENTTNEKVLAAAREEIWQSWRRACAENADHPRAKELFDRRALPAFHDPFAGGGALPLEAQRLGLRAYASDLNPVAVLINKAMIEIPPKFAGKPPVNPAARKDKELIAREWKGCKGLAEDVRYYGQWIRDQAVKRIGHLYPAVEITAEMGKERSELKRLVGKQLTVVAWLWVRTVKSPNPAFAKVHVPLASSFIISTREGREAYVEPVRTKEGYSFRVRCGVPTDVESAKLGTRAGKAQDFRCVMSGVPIPRSYVRDEGKAGRLGSRLMALVVEGDAGQIYLSPVEARPPVKPTDPIVEEARRTFLSGAMPTRAMTTGGVCTAYGVTTYGQLFTARQIVALVTLSDLVAEVRKQVVMDTAATGVGRSVGEKQFNKEYADAVALYLAFSISKCSDYWNSHATWMPRGTVGHLFARHAIPMTWDFPEANPFADFHCSWLEAVGWVAKCLETVPAETPGSAEAADAAQQAISRDKIVSTDPPYYDNIGYAELSDFFYAWLRRALKDSYPELFATMVTPKVEELIAIPQRHGGREQAEKFFLDGMTKAMHRLAEDAHPSFPVTIYYAFKQTETENEETASTGWETFLEATIRAGFALSGTWPIRTERQARSIGIGTNALASSIVLVCHRRPEGSRSATRREFVNALREELPAALAHLQRGNIAPVDLAQAAIGPGMAVYTRYAKVLDAEGKPLRVREALTLINQTLDEALAEQEGDFDADSRWALAWFEQLGFAEGEYGVAETLSKAKNTSVRGLDEAGILASSRGKVRLLKPAELPANWDPTTDKRLTAWEMVHHLIRVLERDGESTAAMLAGKLGSKAEIARELCYRLYTLCERKKRAPEALSYNALVKSWPEITRLVREGVKQTPEQAEFFER